MPAGTDHGKRIRTLEKESVSWEGFRAECSRCKAVAKWLIGGVGGAFSLLVMVGLTFLIFGLERNSDTLIQIQKDVSDTKADVKKVEGGFEEVKAVIRGDYSVVEVVGTTDRNSG